MSKYKNLDMLGVKIISNKILIKRRYYSRAGIRLIPKCKADSISCEKELILNSRYWCFDGVTKMTDEIMRDYIIITNGNEIYSSVLEMYNNVVPEAPRGLYFKEQSRECLDRLRGKLTGSNIPDDFIVDVYENALMYTPFVLNDFRDFGTLSIVYMMEKKLDNYDLHDDEAFRKFNIICKTALKESMKAFHKNHPD